MFRLVFSRPAFLPRVAVVTALLAGGLFVLPNVQANPAHSHPSGLPLHFAKGRNRVVVVGKLGIKLQQARNYTLSGRAGQRLTIDLKDITPRGAKPDSGLVTMYHVTFPSGKAYGMKGYDPFNGRLTETGTYQITVEVNTMASEGTEGSYRLTLTRL